MHRSRLPVLQPCDQDWASMSGSGPRRHCSACDHEVLDLSAMHAQAAIEALIARAGRACIRYRSDAAGVTLGMVMIVEHDPAKSLFDRESTAGPGRDWWTTARLLRMKHQQRREERQRRREARQR